VALVTKVFVILAINQLNAQNLFYNKFIIRLYMFRALLGSSSGGQMKKKSVTQNFYSPEDPKYQVPL